MAVGCCFCDSGIAVCAPDDGTATVDVRLSYLAISGIISAPVLKGETELLC